MNSTDRMIAEYPVWTQLIELVQDIEYGPNGEYCCGILCIDKPDRNIAGWSKLPIMDPTDITNAGYRACTQLI